MPPCGEVNSPLQQGSADPEVGVCDLSCHGNDDEPQTGKARSALPVLRPYCNSDCVSLTAQPPPVVALSVVQLIGDAPALPIVEK